MITRRGFFRGLLAAATTVVARAYVPSALTPVRVELLEPLHPATQALCNTISELHARLLIYGNAAFDEKKWAERYVQKLGLDAAMLDQWPETDDRIAQLGSVTRFRWSAEHDTVYGTGPGQRPNRWTRRQHRLASAQADRRWGR